MNATAKGKQRPMKQNNQCCNKLTKSEAHHKNNTGNTKINH